MWPFFFLLTFTGCAMVPLSTTLALRDFDPLRADPAGLRANVRVPDTLRVLPGSTRLTFLFSPRLARASEEFVLQLIDEPAAPPTGRLSFTLRVAEADLERLRHVQSEVRDLRATGTRNNGSLTLTALPCRVDASASGPWAVDAFLRVVDAAPWLPVARGMSVSRSTPPICD